MVTIVVYHPSTFAAYLIAFSIHFYYHKERELRIIILEDGFYSRFHTQLEQPWCGVNTFSNQHISHQEFFNHFVFKFLVLLKAVVSLEAVNLSHNKGFGSVPHINAQVSEKSTVGILYHPSTIIEHLRNLAFQSPNITQASIQKFSSPEDLEREIRARQLAEKVVLFNYHSPFKTDRSRMAISYQMRESTSSMEYGPKSHIGLPGSVLWVPQFRPKLLEAYGELGLQWHIAADRNTVKVRAFPHSMDEVQHEVMLEIDVFFGLKAADLTLLLLEREMGISRLNSRL